MLWQNQAFVWKKTSGSGNGSVPAFWRNLYQRWKCRLHSLQRREASLTLAAIFWNALYYSTKVSPMQDKISGVLSVLKKWDKFYRWFQKNNFQSVNHPLYPCYYKNICLFEDSPVRMSSLFFFYIAFSCSVLRSFTASLHTSHRSGCIVFYRMVPRGYRNRLNSPRNVCLR